MQYGHSQPSKCFVPQSMHGLRPCALQNGTAMSGASAPISSTSAAFFTPRAICMSNFCGSGLTCMGHPFGALIQAALAHDDVRQVRVLQWRRPAARRLAADEAVRLRLRQRAVALEEFGQ